MWKTAWDITSANLEQLVEAQGTTMQTLLKCGAADGSTLTGFYILSLLFGVTVMVAFTKLGASNAESPHHVYELRMYHVHPGKMDALKARFGDHTDAISSNGIT